jgi:hypothetical protein
LVEAGDSAAERVVLVPDCCARAERRRVKSKDIVEPLREVDPAESRARSAKV